MKISKIFTALTLSSVFAFLSSYPTPKISELKAQTLTGRPLAILVNGKGDCCVQDLVSVRNYLSSINADVYISPWNSLSGGSEGSSDLNDSRFLREAADYLNNQVTSDRPIILIGHSFGGDSLLKLFTVGDVRVNRRISFLGVLDPVTTMGNRSNITVRGVSPNVNYFFNRWQTNVPWPVDLGNGTIQNCQARQCDQQEQSLARKADGSEIRRKCRADEFCRDRTGRTLIDFLGDVVRDDYGSAAERLLHEKLPTDAYIQQQIVDALKTSLASPQPVASKPNVQQADTYLEQQRGSNGNEAQQWKLRSVGNGVYVIENVRLSREQGIPMILDYKQGNVTYLEQQRGPNGNEAQQWRLRSVGNEVYVIENVRLSREQGIPMILDYSAR